jgi:hypothetical protein
MFRSDVQRKSLPVAVLQQAPSSLCCKEDGETGTASLPVARSGGAGTEGAACPVAPSKWAGS